MVCSSVDESVVKSGRAGSNSTKRESSKYGSIVIEEKKSKEVDPEKKKKKDKRKEIKKK